MRDAGRITLRTIILLSTFLLFGRAAVADQCGVLGRVSNGTLLDLTLSGMVTVDTDTGDMTNGGGTLVSGGAAGTRSWRVFTNPSIRCARRGPGRSLTPSTDRKLSLQILIRDPLVMSSE
jgi:hypothetical protein